MSLLDKKYVLTINLEDSTITYPLNMSFFNTDKNIANLYVKVQYRDEVIKYISKTDAVNYNIKLTVIKPKSNNLKEVQGVITNDFEEDYAIYKFELPSEFTDQVGLVVCEFLITNANEILTTSSFSYTIKASKVTGLNPEIIPNPDLPVLKQLIEDVKSAQQWISNIDDVKSSEVKTYSSKKIEDIKAKVDEQFISIKNEKTDKSTTNNLQQQVNNLVLGAVGDGNNAEIIQSRGRHRTLNDRLDINDTVNTTLISKIPEFTYHYDSFVWKNGFINKNGSITSSNDYEYTELIINSNVKSVEFVKGFNYTSEYCIVALDSNNTVVQTLYGDIVYNIKNKGNISKILYFYKIVDVSKENIKINFVYDNEISSMGERLDDVLCYELSELNVQLNVDVIARISEEGCLKNGNVMTIPPDFSYIKYDISNYDSIIFGTGSHEYYGDYKCCFYDSEGNFINNITNNIINQQVTCKIPSNAKYLGYYFHNRDLTNNPKLIYVKLITNKYVTQEQLQANDDKINSIKGTIEFTKDNKIWSYFFLKNGEQVSSSPTEKDVYLGATIQLHDDASYISFLKGFNYFDVYRCCFYDSEMTFIQNVLESDNVNLLDYVTVKVPSSAKYFSYYYKLTDETSNLLSNTSMVKVILSGENIANVLMSVKLNTNTDYYNTNILKKPFNLNGKKVLFLGDSITNGVTDTGTVTPEKWVKHFCEFNNIIKYYNYASSGARYTTGIDNNIFTQLNRVVTNIIDIDIIFVAMGTNDYGNNIEIGDSTSIDTTTFNGALNKFIDEIKKNFNDKEIIFISPINRLRLSNPMYDLNEYRECIFNKTVLNGYDYIDGSSFPFKSIRDDYMNATMNDGLHPSLLGHKLFAKYLSTVVN